MLGSTVDPVPLQVGQSWHLGSANSIRQTVHLRVGKQVVDQSNGLVIAWTYPQHIESMPSS